MFTSAFVTEPSSFDSVIPKIAGFIQFVMPLSSSILVNKLFTFKWQKCKALVLRGSHVLSPMNYIWQGPGFKLTSTESSNNKW